MSFNDTISRKKIIEYFPKKYLPEETFDILSYSKRSICDLRGIDVYGKTQLTYKGWPLYYFGQDANRGDNKGISFPAPGVWPIANTETTIAP